MSEMTSLPHSKYFELAQLADGVYAAIARNRGAASNAGIVNLGDSTLIFDTFMTPQAAEDLRGAAEWLTRSPVRYVVNSHWHGDHINGNAVFAADISLISTAQTRILMEKHAPGAIRNLRQQKPTLETDLRDLQAQLLILKNESKRAEVQQEVENCLIMLDALPTLKLQLPNWTFEQQLVLHGSERAAELLTFGGGHTDSDTILYLPDVGIAFVADLLFNHQHPWMGHGHPAEWLRILDDLDGLDTPVIVPGHGPVGTPEDYNQMREYIPAVQQVVEELLAAAATSVDEHGEEAPDIAKSIEVPAKFRTLEGSQRFANNVQALYERGRTAQP
jgi:cyclase